MSRTIVIVALTLALLVACGGSATPEPTPTPDATGVTRTPLTPQFAIDGGREDCPAEWLVYDGASFSICYPPDHYAEVWWQERSPKYFSVRLITGDPVAYTPWGMRVWRELEYEPPTVCEHVTEYVSPDAETELAPYQIAGAAGVACTARLDEGAQFKGMVPVPFGGLAFDLNAAREEQLDLAKQILQTIAYGPTNGP